MELFSDVNEVKTILDKMLIQTMELIEEDVTIKINLEKLTNQGNLNIAKTRYTQGSRSVSLNQLPTEDDKEFYALKTISRELDDGIFSHYQLENHEIDKESNHIDPINWFGILIPQTLKTARDEYSKAVELAVESASVRQQIARNCELIDKLKSIKSAFEKSEE